MNLRSYKGGVLALAVNHRFLTTSIRIRHRARLCEVCVQQSGTETDKFPRTSVVTHQYHFTNAPNSSSSSSSYSELLLIVHIGFPRNLQEAMLFRKSGTQRHKITFKFSSIKSYFSSNSIFLLQYNSTSTHNSSLSHAAVIRKITRRSLENFKK